MYRKLLDQTPCMAAQLNELQAALPALSYRDLYALRIARETLPIPSGQSFALFNMAHLYCV